MSAHTDATFLRKFLIMLGALVAFTVFVLLTANLVTAAAEAERGEDPRLHKSVLERIQPVGTVNVAAPPAPPAPPAAAESTEAVGEEAESAAPAAEAAESEAPAVAEVAEAVADEVDSAAPAVEAAESEAPAVAEVAEAVVDEVESAAPAVEAAESEAPAVAEVAEAVVDEAESVAPVAAAAPAAQGATGERVDLERGKYVYDSVCFACHMVGLAGAPKLGDKAAWEPRIAQGMNALLSSVINGKGAMPPKGGRSDLSDADVAATIAYMVGQAK